MKFLTHFFNSRIFIIPTCSSVLFLTSFNYGTHLGWDCENEILKLGDFNWVYAMGLIISGLHRMIHFNFKYNQAKTSLVHSLLLYTFLIVISEGLRLFTIEFETSKWPIFSMIRLLCGMVLGEAAIMALLLITSIGKYGSVFLSLWLPAICLDQGLTLGLFVNKISTSSSWGLTLVVVGAITAISVSSIQHDVECIYLTSSGLAIENRIEDLRPWFSSTLKSSISTKSVCRDLVWLLVAVTVFSTNKLHYTVIERERTFLESFKHILNNKRSNKKKNNNKYHHYFGLYRDRHFSFDNDKHDNRLEKTGLLMEMFSRPVWEIIAVLVAKILRSKLNMVIVFISFILFFIFGHTGRHDDNETLNEAVLIPLWKLIQLLYSILVTSLTPLLANLVNGIKSKNIAVQCQVCAFIVTILALSWTIGTNTTIFEHDDPANFEEMVNRFNGFYLIAGVVDYVN